MKRYLLFFTLLFSLNLQAQQTVTCGVTSNICYPLDCISAYTDNQNYIETYSSSDGVSNLKIEFTSFDVEDSFDFLYIYDAASTDPNKLVATYTGLTLPTSISSTGTSLTLQFVSDGSVTQQGFKAKLECLGNQAPTVTSLSPSNSSNNNAGSADLIIDFNEVVNPVAGKFITIKNAGTNATIEQIDASSANVTGGGTKKINIHPSTNLADGSYYILIDAGAFQDIANADFAGFSNTNDWAFDIRNVTFDGFAGKAAQFKETLGQPATYAEVLDNSAFDLQDEFTIEFWTKIDKLKQDQKIIGKVNDGASKGYLIGFTDGKLFCEFWDTQGKISQLKGGVIEENKWIHVAVTWKKSDGNVIAYLNGVEVGSVGNLTDSWGTNSNSLIIGGDSRNTNQFKLDGKMDEIRIWSESRTSKEIRENIYLTLTGQEHGLISYWQCNDTDNTILRDEKGLFHASLKNGATKVNSTLPVGAGLSETHTVQSGIGIIEDFTTVDLELNIEIYDNIFGTGDIVVSKINGDPNPILTNVITPYSINYWIVRLYGGGNIDASPTFKLNNFITNTDKTPDLSLFKRGSNSDLEWGFVDEGRFISFANQQIGFGDYIDYNMQFAISRGNARQIDSLALVALYNATDGGSWTKKWNLNLPMDTWAGIEIQNRRVVKVQLFENNLVGTLPTGLDVLSELRILNLRSNKLTGNIPNDFGSLSKLQVLNLRANQLEGFVSSNLGNLSELTNLVLGENNLEELPNFTSSNLKSLQLMSVHGNKFTFEDLTHNVGFFPDFVYAPQQKVNDEEQIQAVEGSSVTIETTVKGVGNQYEWFKDGVSLGQKGPTDSYTVRNFAGENIGVYHCEITNDDALDLTLIRNNITITTTLNQADSLALIALYNATDGPNWKDKWDLSTPISQWFGVTLINNSRVETVKLAGNNLVGTLPTELGSLNEMTLCDLGSNEISGTIPNSLGELKKLKFIFLHNNQFAGTIPSELGDMENVEVLLLRGNNLTGNLPNSFDKLLKMRRLEIQGNELTGLPRLSSLKELESLSVENNKLTFGDIEANTGITSDFNYFPQGEIDVRQDLSISWKDNVTFTTTVDGTQNTYQWKKGIDNIGIESTDNTFTINDLDYPDAGIYTCEVSNSLVPNLVLVRKTITLQVEPPGVNQDDSLALVALYDATDGRNWEITWDLQTEVTEWFGITLENGRVTKLALPSNGLAGELPVELGSISRLEELNLQNNDVSSKIPKEIGNLSQLKILNLQDNDLRTEIPKEIGNLTQLKVLNLQSNRLLGEIPNSLGQLSLLENMNLRQNFLEGGIPDFWVSLPNITQLNLSNNLFEGDIPNQIGLLTNLKDLNLSNNSLTGKIPESFNQLSRLQSLFLESNSLVDLPEITLFDRLNELNVSENFLTFEDLEDNMILNVILRVFNYENQKVRDTLEVLGELGKDIILTEYVGGYYNVYEWYSGTELIRGPSYEDSLTLSNASFKDAQTYTLRVRSDGVLGLILEYKFNLKIKPEEPIVLAPEPYCYGDTVIVLSSQSERGEITRWYDDVNLVNSLGDANKIRISLTQDRQTVYAVSLASGLESKTTAVEIILRPTIEKQGNTLVIDDDGVSYQWHFNNVAIEGENSPILTIGDDGFYNVTIFTKEGCEATSQNIEIKDGQFILALEDDNWGNDLQVYPNPSEGILTINLNNAYFGNLTVKVINTLGKELIVSELQKNGQALHTTIDISDLSNGMYILEFTAENEKFRKKIIKK